MYLFVFTLIALIATLVVYWLARTDNANGEVYLPDSMFTWPSDDNNNEKFVDGVITTALVLAIFIIVRNLGKRILKNNNNVN